MKRVRQGLLVKVINRLLNDVLVIEPTVYEDERGYFLESYHEKNFAEKVGIQERFVQDNHSFSLKNVLRGLHYQEHSPQGKLVRAVSGEVFDVVVDLRRNAATFGQWASVILSSKNKRMLWVPQGFAHGFLVLSESADLVYKTTDFYDAKNQRCLIWNDPYLNISWPLDRAPILSEQDVNGHRLQLSTKT